MASEIRMNVPYSQVPNWIFDDDELKTYEKLVYCYLCRCANNGGTAFPSYATIAQKCSISRRAAIMAVKTLEETGYITKYERELNSNIYEINTGGGAPHSLSSASDAPYKELLIKNNGRENFDQDVHIIIGYMQQKYFEANGKLETRISEKQWQQIRQRLRAAMEYKRLTLDSLTAKADRFFFVHKDKGIKYFVEAL